MNRSNSQVETGTKKLISNAVVGIVDIVASTAIANALDASSDWDIKEQFLKLAQIEASKMGVVILNQTGDGFLFMLNSAQAETTVPCLVKFQSALVQGFQKILSVYSFQLRKVQSGLRMGVAIGDIVIGTKSSMAGNLIAAGSVVNKAARLSSISGVNQITFCEELILAAESSQNTQDLEVYEILAQGFSETIKVASLTVSAGTVSFVPNREAGALGGWRSPADGVTEPQILNLIQDFSLSFLRNKPKQNGLRGANEAKFTCWIG